MKEFLDALIGYESGICLEKYDWYMQNLDRRVVKFPRVSAPGRLIRNSSTGLHEFEDVTVSEYFEALGVLPHFEPGNPESLRFMQYRSVNPWGYIGYQVGEALLIELGYYVAKHRSALVDGQVRDLPSFYCGSVAESQWAGGKSEHVFYRPESNGWVVGTDVNQWQGTFTGKGDIFELEDLFDAEKQNRMMLEILRFNYRKLDGLLRAAGRELGDCLRMEWAYSDDSGDIRVRCSVSGLLACCHLNGVAATAELLTSSVVHHDQLGTPSLKYMHMFGGYPTGVAGDLALFVASPKTDQAP